MKMNKRVLARGVIVVIAIAVFAWQRWGTQRAPTAPASATASTAPAKPVKPAPPATLKMGRLTLTACELKQPASAVTTPAFCAKFAVPENRANPKSRMIDLAVAIVKSASQVPAKDLVTYLAGGPGQSALETYPRLAPAFAPLLKHHDILLVDQRGTGHSHPLDCPTASKAMAKLPDLADPAQYAQLVGECATEVEKSADPRFYTTTIAVADLEAVREALGAPKLDLVGVSYGTRMAQQFATAHPDAVRSIVLDGVVPNQLILGNSFGTALERSLKLQAAACTAAPACHKAFGDWYATLHQLYAKLQTDAAQQVVVPDPYTGESSTRTLDVATLAGVVRMFSYSAATAAVLPLAVNEAAHGNYVPLLGQARIMQDDLSASMQGGMQLSVICSEDAPLLKPRPQDAGLLLGPKFVAQLIAECKAWPRGVMPNAFHAAFKSSIPTLLISGERDPVTPPVNAAEVLKGLSDGRSLVVKGLGHAEALYAGCMPNLVNDFIDKLQPKQLDAKCLDRIGPIPAFVNFNGATP